MSRETFGQFITDMGGQARRLTDAPIGEHRTDVETVQGYTRLKAEPLVKSRPHGYLIGPIDRARENFTQATGLLTDGEGVDELRALADAVRQLTPDRRDPERFHVSKDEIAARLRRLARRAEAARGHRLA